MAERSKKSSVWLHFTAIDESKAKCDACKSVLSYKGGATCNLRKHLNAKHPTIEAEKSIFKKPKSNITEITEELPSTSVDSVASTSIIVLEKPQDVRNLNIRKKETQTRISSYIVRPISVTRQKKITDLVLNMIIKDLQPFSVVEDKGFKELMAGLDPSYKLPSRSTFICIQCHEVYQDYCAKCRVLVHILNKRPHNTYNRGRELPENMLQTRESIGQLGIFCLKVIPENTRFGPFTGLDVTGPSLKIKGGRFIVSDDKLKHLNWMQYINPAQNICEQNLFPFRYEDKLYYCSTRRIQEGEELLMYFGEEYEVNLVENVEMDFIPITKKDVENVFACTFCCLGFSAMDYLAEHKAVCHGEPNKIFSVKELTQCPFCKIYLEAKEYFEHHMDYCCETNGRHCVRSLPEFRKLEVEKRSSLRSKAKRGKGGIYKCTQCKFRTMYNADLRQHTNKHYEVKMFKCGICDRRYKARKSLKAHVVKLHIDNEGKNVQESMCDYIKANIKNIKERCSYSHGGEKQYQSSKCKFQTRDKYRLKSLIKIKRLNRSKYKCANCELQTYNRTYLKRHMTMKHLMEINYKCTECEYKTNTEVNLKIHIKARHEKKDYKCMECEYEAYCTSRLKQHVKVKHLRQYDYKCMDCEYMTSRKFNLEKHKIVKHLKEKNYRCAECEYRTYHKSHLELHVKSKHLRQYDYNCMECEYKAQFKSRLKLHVKTKHLQQYDYKCMECGYVTNRKSDLEKHKNAKHLKQKYYKCMECEFKTYYKSHLNVHVKTNHLKAHYFKCMECEYMTNRKSNLETHKNAKHLKENYYKCMECEYKTYRKTGLVKHIKAKHLKENCYECTECEYKTQYKSCLKGHVKTKHLQQYDYKCAECEYKTNRKPYLKLHVKRRHLQQYDYKCPECEYKTNRRSRLEEHVKAIHLKRKDYRCMDCEYKTCYKGNLRKHVKQKHLKHVI